MVVSDRRIALAFRVLAPLVILWGVLRNADVFEGKFDGYTFLFFTVLSNLLGLVWFILQARRTAVDLRREGPRGTSTVSARFGGAVMMALTVTMLIYLFVLLPITLSNPNSDYVPFTLTDNLIHIIAPSLAIADWLVFTPKGFFRWSDPPRWILIPIGYLVISYLYGAVGGDFGNGEPVPYPFMNPATYGWGGVALWVGGLAVALIAVGYVYVVLDRLLGLWARHRASARSEAR
ncbi:Pr6Pr family membrane protein, partial [Microbacterium gorillae]|uniref:Pr6Pr family membrane protein n=1 Tax=Microbacterium gorillae TaxID=1231063 RepID=UPI00058EAE91